MIERAGEEEALPTWRENGVIVMMVMLEKEGQEVKKMINDDDGDQCSGEEERNGHRTGKEKNEMYGPPLFIL